MTPQKSITLNLTKQEAECIKLVFEFYRRNDYLGYSEIKPCLPFIERLQAKVNSALTKK